jgi:hypothetical protein
VQPFQGTHRRCLLHVLPLRGTNKRLHIFDVLAKRLHIICTSEMCSFPQSGCTSKMCYPFGCTSQRFRLSERDIKDVFPERAAHRRCVPQRAAHQRCASASEAAAHGVNIFRCVPQRGYARAAHLMHIKDMQVLADVRVLKSFKILIFKKVFTIWTIF